MAINKNVFSTKNGDRTCIYIPFTDSVDFGAPMVVVMDSNTASVKKKQAKTIN